MNFYLSVLLLVSAVSQIRAGPPSILNVTVFYETYNASSARFIQKQLLYTASTVKAKFNVELVPFGFATFNENPWSIKCERGIRQCYGNIDQACAIEKLRPEKRLEFAACTLNTRQPDESGDRCARFIGESYDEIEDCSYGEEGKKLIIKHGKRTKSFIPRVNHIPFVVFNNKYNARDEQLALENFRKFFCNTFPKDDIPQGCEGFTSNEEEEFVSASED